MNNQLTRICAPLGLAGMAAVALGITIPFAGQAFGLSANETFHAMRLMVACGAVAMLAAKLFELSQPADAEISLRGRRLRRMSIWSAVAFCIAAFFMYYDGGIMAADGYAFIMAGAIIYIYSRLMTARESRRNSHGKKQQRPCR